jgi:surface antigen
MRAIIAGLMGVVFAGQAAASAASWKITKDHWDQADETRFGEFVAGFGEHDCTTLETCFKSSANPYRDTDPPELKMDGDCADFIYEMRAYFAWKNNLPFSYSLYVMPRSGPTEDNRFTPGGNTIAARLQIEWQADADPVRLMSELRWTVSTAMFRVEHVYDQGFQASDFYSPKIAKGAIRPGSIVYDIYGHVVYVYKVTPDGTVHYVDSSPDRQVTRGAFGPQIPRSGPELGAMFKNFRPIKLVDYTKDADGTLINGRFVLSANAEIPDYSPEQYFGTEPNAAADWKNAKFTHAGKQLDFYDYVRAKLKAE